MAEELYAGQIIEFLTKELEARLPVHCCTVFVRQGPSLVNDDSVFISYYSRPHDPPPGEHGPWLDNARHTFKVSISAGRSWQRNRPVPDRVTIEQFSRFHVPTMNKMTGTPEKVMSHLLNYVDKNRELLLKDDFATTRR
jgi:hypothetical protein